MQLSSLHYCVISLLMAGCGFLAGLSYPLISLPVPPPYLVEDVPSVVPLITLSRVTAEQLDVVSTSPDVRFLLDGQVMVPDDHQQIHIPLPAPTPLVLPAENSTESTGACIFVARANGRVYFRAESPQGKDIDPGTRQCFDSEGAAKAAGLNPSKTL